MTGSEGQIVRRRAGNAWHGDFGLLLRECTPAAPAATGANACPHRAQIGAGL